MMRFMKFMIKLSSLCNIRKTNQELVRVFRKKRKRNEMKNNIQILILVFTVSIVAGCDSNSPPEDVMGFEAPTLSSCLEHIKKFSKQKIKTTTIDNPDKVRGLLENGKYFSCEKKETGTKGVYFRGVYMKNPSN